MIQTKITSLNHLKELAKDKSIDCFLLSTGGLRSNKDIHWASGSELFTIYNGLDISKPLLIDDTQEILTTCEMRSCTNIVDGIEKGLFFALEKGSSKNEISEDQ